MLLLRCDMCLVFLMQQLYGKECDDAVDVRDKYVRDQHSGLIAVVTLLVFSKPLIIFGK